MRATSATGNSPNNVRKHPTALRSGSLVVATETIATGDEVDADRGGRDRDRGEREPRESRDRFDPLPAGYQPIVLPGESISKYRNVSPVAVESNPAEAPINPVVDVEAHETAPNLEIEAIPTEGGVEQSVIQDIGLSETVAAIPTVVTEQENVPEPTWNVADVQEPPAPRPSWNFVPPVRKEAHEHAIVEE